MKQMYEIVQVSDVFNGGNGDQQVIATTENKEHARLIVKALNAFETKPDLAYGHRPQYQAKHDTEFK